LADWVAVSGVSNNGDSAGCSVSISCVGGVSGGSVIIWTVGISGVGCSLWVADWSAGASIISYVGGCWVCDHTRVHGSIVSIKDLRLLLEIGCGSRLVNNGSSSWVAYNGSCGVCGRCAIWVNNGGLGWVLDSCWVLVCYS